MNIPGSDLKGVWTAKDFLYVGSVGRGGRRRVPPVGRRVAVIGVGNTAMDAARTAIRLGRPSDHRLPPLGSREPVPGHRSGVRQEEGVQFRDPVNPTRFIGDENGRLTAMELVRMRLEATYDSGLRVAGPVPGSEYAPARGHGIMAIGYGQEELIPEQAGLAVDRWGGIVVNKETGETPARRLRRRRLRHRQPDRGARHRRRPKSGGGHGPLPAAAPPRAGRLRRLRGPAGRGGFTVAAEHAPRGRQRPCPARRGGR